MSRRRLKIYLFTLLYCILVSQDSFAVISCSALLRPSSENSLQDLLQKWNVSTESITSGKQEDSYPRVKLFNGSAAQKASRVWVNQRIRRNSQSERVFFQTPVAPDLPEVSIYHWGRGDSIHYIDQGIPAKQLRFWTKKSGSIELGLYGASHPLSSAMYGHILMEVVLYSEKYPVAQPNNSIQQAPVPSHFFSRDILGEKMDATDGISKYFGLNRNYFYVYDFSVVKQIKWPQKTFIEELWKKTEINSVPDDDIKKDMAKAALQWALTPNFLKDERASLFRSDVRKFATLSDFFLSSDDLGFNSTSKFIDAKSLFRNAILRTVLDSDEQLIDLDTRRPNLPLMLQAYKELSPKALEALNQFMEAVSSEGIETLLLLEMIQKLGSSKSFTEVFSSLADYYESYREYRSSYTFFKPKIMEAEVNIVEGFILSNL